MQDDKLVDATSQIVSAFVAKQELSPAQVPSLIEAVAAALLDVADLGKTLQDLEKKPSSQPPAMHIAATTVLPLPVDIQASTGLNPAVPVSQSVMPDYLVCLEDGKQLKMLKRHLRAVYDMAPDDYRRKWGLPETYPMVAPNYARVRSRLARQGGFGTAIQPRLKDDF